MDKIYTKVILTCSLMLACFIAQSQEYRSIDGRNNNLNNPDWGAANAPLLRLTTSGYSDGISTPAGANRPNPRTISNELFAQDGFLNDTRGLSDFTWVFGQFVDHDVTFVLDGEEPLPIAVPAGDPHFDPYGTGQVSIGMHRSAIAAGSGTSPQNPRNHPNAITAFLDASAVYGSDIERANWLRTFTDGKLKVSHDNMLPFNTITGEYDDPVDSNAPHMDDAVGLSDRLFVAGDARANENPLLAAYHTLFVREHNRLCEEIKSQYPDWSDEELYQYARKIVGGLLQSIVYNEWLPTMGVELPAYRRYNSSINPSITNTFSAAAFRLGHTLLNGNLLRLDSDGNSLPGGSLPLRFAFFNVDAVKESGIEPFLQGMAAQVQQSMDAKVIDDVRNFLFGPPGAGGMDLAAINIQRGRERGLADYNTIRQNVGLPALNSFHQINNRPDVFNALQSTYRNINDIDPWVGMLAEAPMNNALFGETIMRIMQIQFVMLRDGDRFYFENDAYLPAELKEVIRATRMVDIIKRNTSINLMQANVFKAADMSNTCGTADIVGSVQTETGLELGNVEIKLDGLFDDRQYVSVTTEDGNFNFNNIAACGEYKIQTNTADDDWRNGLTTYDMLLLLKHITGERTLDSPYKMIAADVDGSGSLTTNDIIEMRRVFLGHQTAFSTNKVWQFIDSDYTFQNPNNPLSEDFEEISFTGNDLHITAVKMGDLNASVAIKGRSSNWEDNNQLVQRLKMRHIPGNRNHQIQLYFEEDVNLQGFQFDLRYDRSSMSLAGLRTGRLPQLLQNNFKYDNTTGNLRASWVHMGTNIRAGEILATLIFYSPDGFDLCNSISLDDMSVRSELYDDTGIKSLELDCSSATTNASVQLGENEPNPFEESTMIRFTLPEQMTASLSIVDNRGQVLHSIEQVFEAGENEVMIYRSMLGNVRGSLFYRLEAEGTTLVRKMVVE